MNFDWQSLVVYVTIGASVIHLLRAFSHVGDEHGSGCGSCGTASQDDGDLVQIRPASSTRDA